jgi:uncharacterized protein (DUF433 family)
MTHLQEHHMASVEYAHICLEGENVPMIVGTRIKVVEIVLDHLARGADADEIHRQFPHLTMGQIHGALAYYYDHQEDMDADIARQLERVQEFESRLGDASFAEKLKARRGLRKDNA